MVLGFGCCVLSFEFCFPVLSFEFSSFGPSVVWSPIFGELKTQNLKSWIPGFITLVASLIVNNNAPELIASESFRYFSLFILLSGLSSGLLMILISKIQKSFNEQLMAIFFLYTMPTMFYTLVFIGDDFDNIKFIMSFF